MMTGLTTPTAGDCLIKGCSIVDETQSARLCLGYCPQSNVMYGHITVMEHLQIYAAIKGIQGGSWSATAVEAAEQIIRASIIAHTEECKVLSVSNEAEQKLSNNSEQKTEAIWRRAVHYNSILLYNHPHRIAICSRLSCLDPLLKA